MGQMIGTVDGIGDLLCFVGDAKCSCFQQITADVDGVRFDQWATKVEEIISACGGSASGGRALSGVAFQAASDICTPRFDDDVRPVLDAACGSCHVMGSSGNFNFASGHSALVDVASGQSALAYVKAGDPDASYLLHKLRGTHLSAGGSGSQMPFGGMLPPADIDLVEAWIASGAQP